MHLPSVASVLIATLMLGSTVAANSQSMTPHCGSVQSKCRECDCHNSREGGQPHCFAADHNLNYNCELKCKCEYPKAPPAYGQHHNDPHPPPPPAYSKTCKKKDKKGKCIVMKKRAADSDSETESAPESESESAPESEL